LRVQQFMVRRYRDGLLVTHDARVESDRTRTIKFDVDHVFRPGRLVLVTISSGPKGTTVYLDGQAVQSFAHFRISRSELAGELVLGTAPATYAPWLGEVHGLAIYAEQLTPAEALRHYQQWTDASTSSDLDGAVARYTFAEGAGHEVRNQIPSGPDLEIPARFSMPHKAFLRPVTDEFKLDLDYLNDVLVNIAGFVPLGVIVCAYFGWTKSGKKRFSSPPSPVEA